MRRFATPVLLALALAFVSGCGKSSYQKNADYADEMIAVLNLYAEALESVKDQATAKAAATKINEANDRMEELMKKKDSIPKVTLKDKERLDKEYKPKLEAATQRMQKIAFTAGLKSKGEPTFLAAVKRMQSLGQKYGTGK